MTDYDFSEKNIDKTDLEIAWIYEILKKWIEKDKI